MKRADPLAAIPDDDLRPTARPRAVQYFSDEYLQRCRCLSAQDIVQFLEEFRLNYAAAEAARQGIDDSGCREPAPYNGAAGQGWSSGSCARPHAATRAGRRDCCDT